MSFRMEFCLGMAGIVFSAVGVTMAELGGPLAAVFLAGIGIALTGVAVTLGACSRDRCLGSSEVEIVDPERSCEVDFPDPVLKVVKTAESGQKSSLPAKPPKR